MYDRIKELLINKNIYQSELERRAGLGKGTISRWKSSKPSIENLSKVAEILEVNVEYLMDGTFNKYSKESATLDARMSKDPQLKRIYSYYVTLNAAQKDMIEQMIRGLANEQNKKE